jgi:tetratricopeptide (TPR) repeat protein
MKFETIARFLSHPLILIGFVLYLFSIISKSLINRFSLINEKDSANVAKKLLKLFFILSITIIILGFALSFYKAFKTRNDANIIRTNDLYLTFQEKSRLDYNFDAKTNDLLFPEETLSLKIDNAQLSFNDLVGWQRENYITRHNVRIYLLNRKSTGYTPFWIKLYIPPDIGCNIIGTNVNMAYNSDKNMYEYYFEYDSTELNRDAVLNLFIMCSFNIQPLDREIDLPYIIGTNNSGFVERKLTLKISTTSNITADLICNYKGLKYLYERKFREAITEFACAIKLNPLTPEYYYNFGQSALQTGEACKSAEYIYRAIVLKPKINEGFYWANYGFSLALCADKSDKKKLKSAERAILKAIEYGTPQLPYRKLVDFR